MAESRRALGKRQDAHLGMLWFLKGERVVALTTTAARFSGGLASYRRP